MIHLNPLTNDLDRLIGRKCATCSGAGEVCLGPHAMDICPDCRETPGWAVKPIRAEVCTACDGTGQFPENLQSFTPCGSCSGTGERWPDVLLTVDVFDPIQLGIAVAAQRNVKTGLGFTNKLRVNIFAAAAAYQGRVFFRVESEASARAFAERMKLGNDNASSIYRAKIELTGNTDSIPWPLPNVIPVAVLGRECTTCKGSGERWQDREASYLETHPTEQRLKWKCLDCVGTGTIPVTKAEADALVAAVQLIPAAQHAVQVIGVEDGWHLPGGWECRSCGKVNTVDCCDATGPDKADWKVSIDILLVSQQVLGSVGGTPLDRPRQGTEPNISITLNGSPTGQVVPYVLSVLPSGEKSLGATSHEPADSRVRAPTAGNFVQLLEDALEARVEVVSV